MVFAHNLTAMNAQRQFNIVGTAKKKSTEKLSSGYKINRAADDAAGLTISEKMRKQVRGLDRASDNCQDGVSLCQVADGALAETHEILQRINELSIQSANGTNSSSDRAAIQAEVKQLTDEIDRIATTTSFNERIYPLSSSDSKLTFIKQDENVDVQRIRVDANGKKWMLPDSIAEYECEGTVKKMERFNTIVLDGITYNVGDTVTFKAIGRPIDDTSYRFYADIIITGINTTHKPEPNKGVEVLTSDLPRFSLEYSELQVNTDGYIYFEHKDGRGLNYYIKDSGITLEPGIEILEKNNFWKAEVYTEQGNNILIQNANGIPIHAGSESDMTLKIPINIVNATKKGLGLTDPEIDLSTEDGATAAIDRVKNAIEIVSGYRSYFGATQNRMEHTIANLDNVVENTQAAESRIRDTDMAKEMVNNTKLNILEQAVTSMMTQANQSTQGVLSLLQ